MRSSYIFVLIGGILLIFATLFNIYRSYKTNGNFYGPEVKKDLYILILILVALFAIYKKQKWLSILCLLGISFLNMVSQNRHKE